MAFHHQRGGGITLGGIGNLLQNTIGVRRYPRAVQVEQDTVGQFVVGFAVAPGHMPGTLRLTGRRRCIIALRVGRWWRWRWRIAIAVIVTGVGIIGRAIIGRTPIGVVIAVVAAAIAEAETEARAEAAAAETESAAESTAAMESAAAAMETSTAMAAAMLRAGRHRR